MIKMPLRKSRLFDRVPIRLNLRLVLSSGPNESFLTQITQCEASREQRIAVMISESSFKVDGVENRKLWVQLTAAAARAYSALP